MDRLLAKLERKYGKYSIGGMTYYLLGLMGLVLVANLASPGLASRLDLVPERILNGEFHRLFTWVVLPPGLEPLWGLLGMYFVHMVGTNLEAQWGSFKYEVYWATGIVITVAIAMAVGIDTSNSYLLMSLFLAFATLFPDYQILLFFFIPLKVKWLAILDGLMLLVLIGWLPGFQKLFPVASVANYLLYFGPELWALLRGFSKRARHQQRSQAFRRDAGEEKVSTRKCTRCGITDVTDPKAEFRVCICEKCGGKPTEFCLAHARDH
jgi:hypothetical protein